MKKLILAMAVVATAAAVHASSFTWGLGSGSFDTTKFASGKAYLFYGSNGAALSLPDTTTWAAKALFTAGDLKSANATQLQTATIRNGLFVNKEGTEAEFLSTVADGSSVVPSDVGATTTKQTYFYMALISDDGKTVALSTVVKKPIAASTTTVSATWSTSDITPYYAQEVIPEPTSGLLLLVGVAGLALRRRRA